MKNAANSYLGGDSEHCTQVKCQLKRLIFGILKKNILSENILGA